MFRDINFGFTSAETESANAPDLLINGYVDFRNSTIKAKNSSKFLFLGYKGAGKSAVGERLSLLSQDRHDEFVKVLPLADFPFTPFSKIVKGNVEPEAKYPTAWAWILLIYLLHSFDSDAGVTHTHKEKLNSATDAFREMGFAPNINIAGLVRTSAKSSFKLKVPEYLEVGYQGGEIRSMSELPNFVDSLKELIAGVRSDSQHIIIIDGLDDILTYRDIQYRSIGSLIFEANRLNNLFARSNVPAKIIILCRTDLFERLDGANKNKVRKDSGIEFDWYHDPRVPEKSQLIEIANRRASLSLKRPVDVFREFFPHTINGADSRTFLLDMTRHTPRDFLQLLKDIQDFSEGGQLTVSQVLSGLRKYSIDYFLPEIKDELVGYAEPEEISKVFAGFSAMRKRDFAIEDLAKSVTEVAPEKMEKILSTLFDCSAIGNIQHQPGGNTVYTFKFRNRQSVFVRSEGIMLHRGLWKALNLI